MSGINMAILWGHTCGLRLSFCLWLFWSWPTTHTTHSTKSVVRTSQYTPILFSIGLKKKKTSTIFCIVSPGICSILGLIFKLKASQGQETTQIYKDLRSLEKCLIAMTISLLFKYYSSVEFCLLEDSSAKQLHLDLKASHLLLCCQIFTSAGYLHLMLKSSLATRLHLQ